MVVTHTYPDAVADDMQQLRNDCDAKMRSLIGEFRSKYSDTDESQT